MRICAGGVIGSDGTGTAGSSGDLAKASSSGSGWAVAAGSSGFLIVVFHIGGKGIVHYETDIVLIYTHAEGVCRNYKINFP